MKRVTSLLFYLEDEPDSATLDRAGERSRQRRSQTDSCGDGRACWVTPEVRHERFGR